MRTENEINPLVKEYFAGQLDAQQKMEVKQRLAQDPDFLLDFTLEEERLRREIAAMIHGFEPPLQPQKPPRLPFYKYWQFYFMATAILALVLALIFLVQWNPAVQTSGASGAKPEDSLETKSVPPHPQDGNITEPPVKNGDSDTLLHPEKKEKIAPPLDPTDTVEPSKTIYVSSPPANGVLRNKWERKEIDNDPTVWLSRNGIAIPQEIPDYVWGSVTRVQTIEKVPIFGHNRKVEQQQFEQPKSRIAVLVFQTAYLPYDQYLFGDSLWLFLKRDTKRIVGKDLWLNQARRQGPYTLHIGDDQFTISKEDMGKGLQRLQ